MFQSADLRAVLEGTLLRSRSRQFRDNRSARGRAYYETERGRSDAALLATVDALTEKWEEDDRPLRWSVVVKSAVAKASQWQEVTDMTERRIEGAIKRLHRMGQVSFARDRAGDLVMQSERWEETD